MKIITVLVLTMLNLTAAFAQSTSEKIKADFHSLSWLEGSWTRFNIKKPGRTASEQWKKTGEYELSGLGVTRQGNDTVFVEKLKIIIQGNEIHYVADVPENPNPVHFIFTKLSSNEFICENPNHDYPKKIAYRLEGNTLKAQTSGDGKVQEFVFENRKK
jgi:hypothetical protein